MSKNEKKFDDILNELEKIVESMSNEEIKLEDAIESYEQGVKLLKQAQASLKIFENKIKILNDKNNLEDFDPNEQ
ncbi:MAG: exodeoxyribonuclease VII small subunit [Nitrosomonadales bacterium]|jgi:exodeoxyribonuclease VII small subunit